MFEFSSNFPWHVQLQKRVCPSWQGRKERKKPFFTMPASVSESYNPYDKNTCNHTICNIRIQSNTATEVGSAAFTRNLQTRHEADKVFVLPVRP